MENNIVTKRDVLDNSTGKVIENSLKYPMNDLQSVFATYRPELGINLPTDNTLNGGNDNGKVNE